MKSAAQNLAVNICQTGSMISSEAGVPKDWNGAALCRRHGLVANTEKREYPLKGLGKSGGICAAGINQEAGAWVSGRGVSPGFARGGEIKKNQLATGREYEKRAVWKPAVSGFI